VVSALDVLARVAGGKKPGRRAGAESSNFLLVASSGGQLDYLEMRRRTALSKSDRVNCFIHSGTNLPQLEATSSPSGNGNVRSPSRCFDECREQQTFV